MTDYLRAALEAEVAVLEAHARRRPRGRLLASARPLPLTPPPFVEWGPGRPRCPPAFLGAALRRRRNSTGRRLAAMLWGITARRPRLGCRGGCPCSSSKEATYRAR